MLNVLALVLALASLGCSSAAQSDSQVAGRVGSRDIMLSEVDARWEKEDAAGHAEAVQKLYDGRRGALSQLVSEILITEAAKGTGLSAEAFEEAEISRRARAVTEAEVESFYKTNAAEMGGRTFETAAPLIHRFLEEQYRSTARQALVAELMKKGPAVRVLLEAPRHTVTVEPGDPSRGSRSAPVTVVEFSDFQCPYCLRASPTLRKLQQDYGDKVRLVWKDFPLTQIHPQAFKAAEAAHCAGEQEKFWEFHDRLFANQQALNVADLQRYARELSLDSARFDACLTSSKYAERVRDGVAQGTTLGVNSTPTIYINGRMFAGAYPYEELAAVVEEELKK
jgi:protein-disulfide isomerase